MDAPDSPRLLKTLTTADQVLDVMVAAGDVGVTELADRLDIGKTTAHRYLRTLTALGFVAETDGRYSLSYRFLLLGELTRRRNKLYQTSRAQVDDLATEFGYFAHLVVETDGYGINLYQARGAEAGDYDYQSVKMQQRDPLYVTAAGKAILAEYSRERVEDIIEGYEFEPRTDNTITSREELFDALESIRERGYAYNDEEEIQGFRAVAAAIHDEEGAVLGSVTLSAPTSHLSGDTFREEIPALVVKTVNIIEVNINMSVQDEVFTTE